MVPPGVFSPQYRHKGGAGVGKRTMLERPAALVMLVATAHLGQLNNTVPL